VSRLVDEFMSSSNNDSHHSRWCRIRHRSIDSRSGGTGPQGMSLPWHLGHLLTCKSIVGAFRWGTRMDEVALPSQICPDHPVRPGVLSNTGRKYAQWIQRIAFAAVSGLLIASITYYLTACTPLAAAWTPNLGHCLKQRAGWLGTSIANLITDVVIFSGPVMWLMELQMSLHNKITVGIQLFLGAL